MDVDFNFGAVSEMLKEVFGNPVLALCLLCYALIAALLCGIVWFLTRRFPAWLRLLVRTLSLALVITPSLIGGASEGGAGVFPAPVIFVFIVSIEDHNWIYLLCGAVVPVVCVWLLALIISLLYHKFFKKRIGPAA